LFLVLLLGERLDKVAIAWLPGINYIASGGNFNSVCVLLERPFVEVKKINLIAIDEYSLLAY
jgi:hypothetical protein